MALPRPMPPEPRFVPRFAAEPPQELLPYGRWAEQPAGRVPRAPACASTARTRTSASRARSVVPRPHLAGRTVRAGHARTSTGFELFGYVSFAPRRRRASRRTSHAAADFTDETAEANPEWTIDLSDEVVGAGAASRATSPR